MLPYTLWPDEGAARPGAFWGVGTFAPNGGSNPVSTSNGGSLKGKFSVVRTSTGLFTVTLDTGLRFPENPVIEVSNSYDGTNFFWTLVSYPTSSGWQNTARQFTISTMTGATTTLADIVADARTRVSFFIEGISNTGK